MTNLTNHKWTQSGHFFPWSGHFCQYLKKGRGDLSPPQASCTPEQAALWMERNIFKKTLKTFKFKRIKIPKCLNYQRTSFADAMQYKCQVKFNNCWFN